MYNCKHNTRVYIPMVEDKIPVRFTDNPSREYEKIPSGWVKLSKKRKGANDRSYLETSTRDCQCDPIELLQHNIDLSFEFEKNRYFHPYQQKYQDTFNNTDSESDSEETE